ncbi:MAG: tail fiber assembly protein [Enterobacter sp.]|jgi:hypothetical protein|nr:tail fiber assembly protein [Enterobacter sp.]
MSERFFYSAKTNGFYPYSLLEDYKGAGNWPDDAVEISERWYLYLLEGQGAGKIISSNEYGSPVLSVPPEPSAEELIARAEETRSVLMKEANARVTPLQDADELGIATGEEMTELTRWKRYRVMLNRLDISAAPSIEWPELPA